MMMVVITMIIMVRMSLKIIMMAMMRKKTGNDSAIAARASVETRPA